MNSESVVLQFDDRKKKSIESTWFIASSISIAFPSGLHGTVADDERVIEVPEMANKRQRQQFKIFKIYIFLFVFCLFYMRLSLMCSVYIQIEN